MARKKVQQDVPEIVPAEISLSPITDSLKENYMPYAMSVIISRAIPEIDGFKPSQRKILYTMYRMGLMKGARAKSADIVGQTMALNPHGDQAIYETMVRMTRGNGALLNPWIDSKGNFGRVYSRDMQYAAYRYTEARLDPSCEILFKSLNQDAVDFVDNYSGTMKEPTLLPAQIPTILLNANQGIAVGMASNICSFNLRELCETTCALLDDPEHDLLTTMPAPDFSTGADLLYDPQQMRQIYETGRGSFRLSAKYRLDHKHNLIEIYEIPYSTSVETIIDDIANQVKKGKLKEITDVRDETDLQGLKITIEYKKNTDTELLLAKLYKMTSLSANFACNFNLLIGTKAQVLGVRDILLEWLKWRRQCLQRELQYERGQLGKQLHLLKALAQILLDIDRAIQIIRQTEKEAEVVPSLMTAFGIDQQQAEYVAEIKLRHLNREYLLKRTADVEDLEKRLDELDRILNSEKRQNKMIQEQLRSFAKLYGRERRTILISPQQLDLPDESEMIEDYRLKFYLTKEGYLKKLPLTSLRSAGDLKLKDEDSIVQSCEGSNRDELLFFTNKAQVYKLMAHEVQDHKPSDFGDFTPNLLDLEEGERVLAIHLSGQLEKDILLLFFANGKVAKIEAAAYATKNRRKKLLNAFYGGANLVALHVQAEENSGQSYLLYSSQKRLVLFDSDLVPLKKTKNSQGIQVMTLRKSFEVVAVRPLEEGEDLSYYRVRSLPAAGRFIKEESVEGRQVDLFE